MRARASRTPAPGQTCSSGARSRRERLIDHKPHITHLAPLLTRTNAGRAACCGPRLDATFTRACIFVFLGLQAEPQGARVVGSNGRVTPNRSAQQQQLCEKEPRKRGSRRDSDLLYCGRELRSRTAVCSSGAMVVLTLCLCVCALGRSVLRLLFAECLEQTHPHFRQSCCSAPSSRQHKGAHSMPIETQALAQRD